MDNPQDALSALLSNPAALSAAMEMAKSFLSGAGGSADTAKSSEESSHIQGESSQATANGDHGVSDTALTPLEDDKTRLLYALKPFLSPKRSEKVGTVLSIMRVMQMMGSSSLFDFGKGS